MRFMEFGSFAERQKHHERGSWPGGGHCHERRAWRGERGPRDMWGGPGRGGFGGFGRGRERLFNAGDLKLVILRLLVDQPSYGYQLMKTMEERLAGGYSPSAGVI